MVAIPFPTSSRPGERPALGQGRLVNAYATKEGAAIRWKRVPGLKPFAVPSDVEASAFIGPRGLLWAGHELIAVVKDRVARIDGTGKITLLNGTFAGDTPVTIARNNNATPDIVAVGKTSSVKIGSSVVPLDMGTFPQPNSVSSLDGYLIYTSGAGDIIATGLNTTTIPAGSMAKAESNPDGLLRGLVSAQLFYAMGQASIEVYQDVGRAPFPLERVAVIPVGLMAPFAVAGGQQEGWDTYPIFVARDGTVRRLSGYQEQIVSTPDVVRDILAVADKSTLVASVYVVGEMAVWSLSSPSWTWELNVSTGEWHQRRSYGLNRWRAAFSANAFDRWIVGDTQSGTLFELSPSTLAEGTNPLVFEVESDTARSFPARIQCRRADFDFVVGYGEEAGRDPIETNPQVEISWSDDGGVTWSIPVHRSLGREGRFRTLVSVLNTGQAGAQGRKWRLLISDPVDCTLMGGDMQASARIT